MKFNISVIKSEKTTRQGPKSSYIQLELTYKRLDSGKIESKKLMSFGKPEQVYQSLVEAKMDDTFTITSEKNEKTTYWDWVAVEQASPTGSVGYESKDISPKATTSRSTYETPEERSVKQVYIIKQSSLERATEIAAHNNPKGVVTVGEVINVAQTLVDWVMGKAPEVELVDMSDDIPD